MLINRHNQILEFTHPKNSKLISNVSRNLQIILESAKMYRLPHSTKDNSWVTHKFSVLRILHNLTLCLKEWQKNRSKPSATSSMDKVANLTNSPQPQQVHPLRIHLKRIGEDLMNLKAIQIIHHIYSLLLRNPSYQSISQKWSKMSTPKWYLRWKEVLKQTSPLNMHLERNIKKKSTKRASRLPLINNRLLSH